MRSELKTLLAVGLGAVALALAAVAFIRAAPRIAAPPIVSAPAPVPAGPAAAAPPSSPAGAPSPAGPDAATASAEGGAPDGLAPGALVGEVKLGGWLERPLPLCGRAGDVSLRNGPGGEPSRGTLAACEATYGDFPSVTLIPIRARKGDWIELPEGWVRIDEVRTAETLVVDDVEYWHDLFNAQVARVAGRRVTLKGDTDPCAGQVCGDAHGQWEQEQALREQLAASHPDGKIPPAEEKALEQRIAELNEASQREYEAAVKAGEERAREEREIRVEAPPEEGVKPEPKVEGGGYLCCT
jgi:hypothetical protein